MKYIAGIRTIFSSFESHYLLTFLLCPESNDYLFLLVLDTFFGIWHLIIDTDNTFLISLNVLDNILAISFTTPASVYEKN